MTVGPFVVTTDQGGAAHGRCQTDTVDAQVTVDASKAAPSSRSGVVFARMQGEVTVNDRRCETVSRLLKIEPADGRVVADSGHPRLRTERGGHPRTAVIEDAAAMISAALTGWLSAMTAEDMRVLGDAVTCAHHVATAAGGARQALDELREIAKTSR